jgi:dynein heavy chain
VFDATTRTWLQPVVPTSAGGDSAPVFTRKRSKVGKSTDTNRAGPTGAGALPTGGASSNAGLSLGGVDLAAMMGSGYGGFDSTSTWEEPIIPDANPDAPTPRGAHSSVLIGEHLFVFGGYGGNGYQRRDFNDVYRLHIPTMTWVHTDPSTITGAVPEARSGHSATPCDRLMLVFGGWSSTQQFNDLHVFDTDKLLWTNVAEAKFGPFRWNHAALCVPAVPNWQLFVFGGSGAASPEAGDESKSNKDKGSYLSDIMVLDSGNMRWTDLTAQATAKGPTASPKPRADSSLVYDGQNKRIITFGGWANRWFNDAWALPVASIIGPPYAVLGLAPAIGPITGKQQLRIEGRGFEPGASANVRFLLGKKFVDASGTATSSKEIEVSTPSYESVGPGVVDVRVSLRGQPLTITSVR